MDKQEINKMKKRALIVVAVIAVFSLASLLPLPSVIQVVLNCIALLVCLMYMVYFLATYCAKSARKGDYSCFIFPLMLFVCALGIISSLPLSATVVALLRLSEAIIAIIGSIVFIAFFARR